MFTTAEVLQATGGRLKTGREDLCFPGVSIDSRTLRAGELFVAIAGDRFDGHDFSEAVIRGGGSGMIVREGWDPPEESSFRGTPCEVDLIEVSDTLRALQDLASFHRSRFEIPLVAVTGTNGKTSVKEMIYSILKTKSRTLRSPGNLNNPIGVPLSLFRLEPGTEAAVVEFGMSGIGEIRRLREIARPTVVVITNVSAAHLKTLGDLDAVARAKKEILEELPDTGWAVLNRDDPRVFSFRDCVPGRNVTFGLNPDADVTAERIRIDEWEGTRFRLRHHEETVEIHLKLPGMHHVSNALCAAAAGRILGRSMADIARGLREVQLPEFRWEVMWLPAGVTVINDAYNANPESVRTAIQTIRQWGPGKRNIAVFGDMLELGRFSEAMHREIGRLAAPVFEILITVGTRAAWIAREAEQARRAPDRVIRCGTVEEAVKQLRGVMGRNDRILIKASRGMHLERIAEALQERGVRKRP